MGGLLFLVVVVFVLEIFVVVLFYGILFLEFVDVFIIKILFQCYFGENDIFNMVNLIKYGELRQQLDVGGVDYEFYEYEVGYVFMNLYSVNYNKIIVELFVGRMIDFMNKYLVS